jgi:hypothetical protein
MGPGVVAAPAPGAGSGNWSGAPSAALDDEGGFVVAYRVRTSGERGSGLVVARSDDGEHLTAVATLNKARFGAASLERPALVRTDSGLWRLYVCCATPGRKHWWIELLEAADPAGFAGAESRVVFPGDRRTGVKDPVIRRRQGGWHAWICCHPLDVPGEEDRMTTAYATSDDGLAWTWRGTVLAGRPQAWDARGARVTAVLADGRASYDGRGSKNENFAERTGLARFAVETSRLVAREPSPVSEARYLDVVPLEGGGNRIYYEAPLADGSHELRTELVM